MRPRLLLLPLCVSVCVKSVCRSLCQSAAKAPIPEKPRLISGTDHCALLVLLIQLSWLNYLPGQETHTHGKDEVLFKAATIQYIAALQGHRTS